MQLTYFLTAAFAASSFAATFNHFRDTACQDWDGNFVTVSAAEQQEIIEKNYATSGLVPQASFFLSSPDDKVNCPPNADDTYAWVSIPQWRGGGAIAVRYYEETDTYNACLYLAASQSGGYSGTCRRA